MSGLVTYTKDQALAYHRDNRGSAGKIEVISKTSAASVLDLTLAYSPGVAEACRAIHADPAQVHGLTNKDNMVAVVSDGTAVLGLGDIGPAAGLPVMEGKAVLFKVLAGIDAFPVCIDQTDPDKIIELVRALEPTFGGINLEDISAPRCFAIETTLKKEMGIPVFHDDQYGTAVVTLSGILNALKIVDKKIDEIKVVVNGAGASGIACTKLLLSAGVTNAVLCDSKGAVYEGRPQGMNSAKDEIARLTNRDKQQGRLRDVIKGADVFLGLSVARQVDADMVRSMEKDAIIFACANPDPEIMPDEALAAGARIVASGRSDFPNQINNVLGFPGIFRGALDVRAADINHEMNVAAAHAVAALAENDLREDFIIVSPLHEEVIAREAAAVAQAAIDTGVARVKADPDEVYRKTRMLSDYNRKLYTVADDLFNSLA